MVSPFDILHLDPGADEEEIDRAYRRRVKQAHPDLGGTAEEFQAVQAAYEQLKSGARRDGLDVGREDIEAQPQRTQSRVEYLNYEVLDDYGWSIDDPDLFEKASAEGLDSEDYGRILVQPGEYLLEAAENRGFRWPYACRGGACANCAVAVAEGELEMPANHILPPEMLERGIRLSCNAVPITDETKVVFNLKQRPDLDDLRLPPDRFNRAYSSD